MIDREAVFATYAVEFGTKSKTMQVIEQLNKADQEQEEALDREAVFASFGTKSKTARVIEQQEQEDELDREAVFASYEAVFASYAAEFGTKSQTARVIEQQENKTGHVIELENKKDAIVKRREDMIDREAVFATYAVEFGTKSKTGRRA
eukprot:TRINITY_DN826_c0_g1_i1.p2 TRINITY_DN826_c0_g1~~TRINITY_DN826_c0_g1_i1.p2  ORF type:complete len:149 (-),score=67.08 TRINITY_DN826_c0_g1_i1:240-686(-)